MFPFCVFINIKIKTFAWHIHFENYLLSVWIAHCVESPPAVNPLFFLYAQVRVPSMLSFFIV